MSNDDGVEPQEAAILVAIRAEAQAKAATEFMMHGSQRIERAIEVMRDENGTQHLEGRRDLQTSMQGLHRRLDSQDTEREKLRNQMIEYSDKLQTDVQTALSEEAKANSAGRAKLHSRIDALVWAWLLAALAACASLGGMAWWMLTNPNPPYLPVA